MPKTKKKRRKKRGKEGRNPVEKLDFATAKSMARVKRAAPFAERAQALSRFGTASSVAAAAFLVAALGAARDDRRMARAGTRMFLAATAATVAAAAVKRAVSRSRPSRYLETGEHAFLWDGPKGKEWDGFPSAHAARICAAARALARDYPQLRGAPLAAAATAGFLKVLGEDHFASDVLAGYALGLGAEWAAAHFV